MRNTLLLSLAATAMWLPFLDGPRATTGIMPADAAPTGIPAAAAAADGNITVKDTAGGGIAPGNTAGVVSVDTAGSGAAARDSTTSIDNKTAGSSGRSISSAAGGAQKNHSQLRHSQLAPTKLSALRSQLVPSQLAARAVSALLCLFVLATAWHQWKGGEGPGCGGRAPPGVLHRKLLHNRWDVFSSAEAHVVWVRIYIYIYI